MPGPPPPADPPDPQALLRSRGYVQILILAAITGLPISAAAYGFLALVEHLQDWLFTDLPPSVYEPIMVHELAHQWFGDSVAPHRWRDVWLNEGHATWYEKLYGADTYPEDYNFEETIRGYYSQGDQLRAEFGPVASPFSAENVLDLFNDNVYGGGATVLYALRQVVGDRTFYEIERRWVRAYKGESASTDDFIALASRVAHRNLGPFLRDWLYGSKTPPMPGHPDWTVDAPGAAPAAPKAEKAPSAASLERLAKR